MKFRTGHVSNSSSSSFTIYGWTEKQLSEHIGTLLPAFVGVEINIDESVFCENIEKLWRGSEWDILAFKNQSGENIFGVGHGEQEADHYRPDFSKDFKFPEPTDKQKKELDEIAVKLGLPAPSIHQETFYDG